MPAVLISRAVHWAVEGLAAIVAVEVSEGKVAGSDVAVMDIVDVIQILTLLLTRS